MVSSSSGQNPEGIQPRRVEEHEGEDLPDIDPAVLDNIEVNAQGLPDTEMPLEPIRRGYGVSVGTILRLCRLAEVKLIHVAKEEGHEINVRTRQVLKLTHVLEAYNKIRPKHDAKKESGVE